MSAADGSPEPALGAASVEQVATPHHGERTATAHDTATETRSIDHRRERICIETERHRIEGYVTLARDGFRSRVSDMLNASERDFLTLTEATVEMLDGSRSERHRFLAVARAHIVFAVVAETSEH